MIIPKAEKLPSGTWRVRMRLGGKSISVTDITEKKVIAKARIIKAEYLSDKRIEAAKDVPKENPTLSQMIDDYIESKSNVCSPSSIRGWRGIQRNRFTEIMNVPYDPNTNWQKVINREARTLSAKTLKTAYGFISSVLAYNDFSRPAVKLPQIIKKERPFLSYDEIKPFIKIFENTDTEVSVLLALHSLRLSEIYGLRWKDVDIKNKQIHVDGAVVPDEHHVYSRKPETKNDSSRRTIPIFIDRLYVLLKEGKAQIKKEDMEKAVVSGNPQNMRKHINKICAEHNIEPVSPHALRHSFASLCYSKNIPQRVTMKLGGWKDATTMNKIYIHLAEKDMAKYTKELTSFYNSPTESPTSAENT